MRLLAVGSVCRLITVCILVYGQQKTYITLHLRVATMRGWDERRRGKKMDQMVVERGRV